MRGLLNPWFRLFLRLCKNSPVRNVGTVWQTVIRDLAAEAVCSVNSKHEQIKTEF